MSVTCIRGDDMGQLMHQVHVCTGFTTAACDTHQGPDDSREGGTDDDSNGKVHLHAARCNK